MVVHDRGPDPILPEVANGTVYVGSVDGKVYALSATTGLLDWSFGTGNQIGSSPVVANGVVYVGSYDAKVYALNATTGALDWSYLTGSSIFSSPAVANGTVYIGSNDDKVYALNRDDRRARLGARNRLRRVFVADGGERDGLRRIER